MRFNFIIIFILCGFSISGQFTEGFEDNNLSLNPMWQGSITDFIQTQDQQLQLNASDAGQSFIYLQTDYTDSLEIGLDTKLDFNPSGSNFMRVYFLLDDPDRTKANGFFINLGKNGSEDNVELYKIVGGAEELIGSGPAATISTEPVLLGLKIIKRGQGDWEVYTSYDGGTLVKEFEVPDINLSGPMVGFFGIECNYTSSRSDKFFIDNVYVKKFRPDKSHPNLVEANFVDAFTIQITFDEALDMEEAVNLQNYNVVGIGNPTVATLGSKTNEVLIEYDQKFVGSTIYQLEVSSLLDLNGNKINEVQNTQLSFIATPTSGEILISELLFDPFPSENDFVEIYNSTDKDLQLLGLTIVNKTRDESKSINFPYVLAGKSYLAIGKNTENLKSIYQPEDGAQFLDAEIPAFNNDVGNVTLLGPKSELLDEFNYEEDMHLSLIDDTEGVSLERLNYSILATVGSNWSSASKDVNYATPGYKNSNTVSFDPTDEDVFTVKTKVFSRNGANSLFVMSYDLEDVGYVGNFYVYNSNGYRIKKIMSNQLLGSQGLVTWDGTDEDSNPVRLGHYVVVGELFNTSGDVKTVKKTCILADLLD